MTAATVVLEAIFEADMPAEQHGYRPNLSAHTAVKEINRLINWGHTRIIDGDLGARLRNRWSRQVAKHCVRGKRYGHEVTLWLWPA